MTADTVRQILCWMDRCSNEHDDTCQQYRSLAGVEHDLPLRLIDVDPEGEYLGDELRSRNIDHLSCEEAPHIRVHYSHEALSKNPNGVQYLTLSHRWSDTEPTNQLTWETIPQFSDQIPISSLSNSFKDAIQITRCLGFRYLWIDSICINQTDSTEQASEIGRMQNIYRYSQLNLSATSGAARLIFPRNPRSVLPILTRTNGAKSSAPEVGATLQSHEEYLMVSSGMWDTYIDLGPLNTRGWVLQERLLAPRVLHCCYNMVFWECPCLRASEIDPLGELDHDAVTHSSHLRTNIKRDFVTAEIESDTAQGSAGSWGRLLTPFYKIVQAYYFSSELTYACDRLPAISGISKWFMTRHGLSPESYVAGLWQETMPWCLLWEMCFVDFSGGAVVRDLEAAPSWSWASVLVTNISRAKMIYMNKRTDPEEQCVSLYENLEFIIVPKNGDRFAQLEVATLRLYAAVIPVNRKQINGTPHMRLSNDSKWYKESHHLWSARATAPVEKLIENMALFGHLLRIIPKHRLQNIGEKVTTRSYVEVRWDTSDMLLSDETSPHPRQLYIIPILCTRKKGRLWRPGEEWPVCEGPWTFNIEGLILQKLHGEGQYARVGMFKTSNAGVWDENGIRGSNPDLYDDILQHIPRPAINKFSNQALQTSQDSQQPSPFLFTESIKRSKWQRTSKADSMPLSLGPDDYLGVNKEGLHLIEIL